MYNIIYSRQKRSHGRRYSSHIIHSSIIHNILSIGNNSQITTAILPRKCVKGRLRGEEGFIGLKGEVGNEGRGLGFHGDGDDYVGDHFVMRSGSDDDSAAVLMRRRRVWCKCSDCGGYEDRCQCQWQDFHVYRAFEKLLRKIFSFLSSSPRCLFGALRVVLSDKPLFSLLVNQTPNSQRPKTKAKGTGRRTPKTLLSDKSL